MLYVPEFVGGSGGVVMTLDNCFGYYNALNAKGEQVGPLVGYAGTYDDAQSGEKKAYVGYEFYNFAMAEQWPFILDKWAEYLVETCFRPMSSEITAFQGMPLGGLAFAQALTRAYSNHCSPARYIYAEKEVLKVKTESSRELSVLLMNRHIFLPGDKAAITEDVTNNFTTTGKGVKLAEESSASIELIVTVLNRSGRTEFVTDGGRKIKVVCVCHKPTRQFTQDDPRVASEIVKGNVIWKPKNVWMQQIYPLILANQRP